MPIGVPLIICGSLALAGSGYAFKKLVYDPHLAHYVEAFIANHRVRSVNHEQVPVPVAAHSSATTTALSKGLNRLRRRGKGVQIEDEEDGEPLIQLTRRDSISTNRQAASTNRQAASTCGVISKGDKENNLARQFQDLDNDSRNTPLRNTDSPTPHDDEIKSLIFHVPPSPNPPSIQPQSNLNPPVLEADSDHLGISPGNATGPSATFSFLSLSQVSSPEAPSAMLDSMTFSHIGTAQSEGDRREEIISLPDTNGYQTDGFSNISSPRNRDVEVVWSPTISHPGVGSSGVMESGPERGLGLSAVADVGMSYISSPRRRESVISLSESDGGGGSDWEAISARSS